MEKVRVREFTSKFSQYLTRMKNGETFLVNGAEIMVANKMTKKVKIMDIEEVSPEVIIKEEKKKKKKKVKSEFDFTPMPKSKSTK